MTEFLSVARTHVGRRRKVNEDAYLEVPDRGLFVVADGMGGHHAGEVAAGLIVTALGAPFAARDLSGQVDETRARLADVNSRLIRLGETPGGPRKTVGSTVVTLIAAAGHFACLWAGDSRAFLVRDGRLEALTKDHSLVQDLVDAGELAPEEARGHPNANVITRAVGAGMRLQLDLREGDVRAGDVFILASDGLTRLLGDAELLEGALRPDLSTTADDWVERSLDRGAPDNLTFVIARARA